ncbi:MAG TPA: pyridoxine 5'-phosphate synthase [Myxococcota bacterium]|nr:pyridoxine 5'-phosphate synthase [Myxococcota bacterium]HRY93933.1 pyridoxine 5'-phosphate synthase [Myxococcota bacterium]HSA23842.1 pyridoxine 5'-phosphate synthase [Myxococcota bacterium]
MDEARLGVNIDHVATLRQARGTTYPDPVTAAALAELGGADQITIHLREDRRHIQERDLRILRETVQTRLNLEMAATKEMSKIAYEFKPEMATLVPEKREELTTEGGLDVALHRDAVKETVRFLKDGDIRVSLFVDPDIDQIRAAHKVSADAVELHTGAYCEAKSAVLRKAELQRLLDAAKTCAKIGLPVYAGHGLNLVNVGQVASILEITEFNIGHSILARAVFIGMQAAVAEMKTAIRQARRPGA